MRVALTIMLGLTLTSLAGQIKGYRHKYTIRPDYSAEQPILLKATDALGSDTNLTVQILDHTGYPFSFARVTIERDSSVFEFQSDSEGMVSVSPKPGNYELHVSGMLGYREFEQEVSIEPKLALHLTVTPARGSTLEIYNVYSKRALTPEQVDVIRSCLQSRGRKDGCDNDDEYIIMMEI